MKGQQAQALQVVQTNLINEAKVIEASLPSHMTMDKFLSMANAALLFNPTLLTLEPRSLAQAFIRAAIDGLAIDNREAAIVPYKGNAQYQVMIDGVLKKLRNSGAVSVVVAKAVFEKDEFDYWFDETGEHIKYRPFLGKDRGDLVLAFASAKLIETGETVVEVMPLEEINRVRASSKAGNQPSSPWNQWFDRMAIKSVLHRIARRLPNSNEVREMLERDIQIEAFRNEVINGSIDESPALEAQDIEKISSQNVADLKELVALTQSEEPKMLSWISARSGRIVNSYEELDVEQFQDLLDALKKKAEKITAN